MSNAEAETPIAETSQQRYNTRKRKLSEDKEVDQEDVVIDKLEQKKLKIKSSPIQEENDAVEVVEEKSENGRVEDEDVSEKIVTRSRKRKLSEDKEKDDKVKPETSRKRKQKEEVEEVKEVVKEVEVKKRRKYS